MKLTVVGETLSGLCYDDQEEGGVVGNVVGTNMGGELNGWHSEKWERKLPVLRGERAISSIGRLFMRSRSPSRTEIAAPSSPPFQVENAAHSLAKLTYPMTTNLAPTPYNDSRYQHPSSHSATPG